MKDGKPSSMTQARIERLESVGLVWAAKRGAPSGGKDRRGLTETRPRASSASSSDDDDCPEEERAKKKPKTSPRCAEV